MMALLSFFFISVCFCFIYADIPKIVPRNYLFFCLFLCDAKSDFINGECLTIDGGVTKKMIYPE